MLKYIVTCISFCIILVYVQHAQAAQNSISELEYTETIQVTGRLVDVLENSNRSISIVTHSEIQTLPASGLADILTYAAGVDIRKRGNGNVQADISIRGASVEQTLILLNGVPVNDSQTGHHSLDLFLTPQNIQQIEILKGHGAGSRGPGGYQGSVNIVTRQPQQTAGSISGEFGSHHASRGALTLDWVTDHHSLSLSGNRAISHGYRDNTEYAINSLFLTSSTQLPNGNLSLTAGTGEKSFGAHKFYSDAYPDQWEATENHWASLLHDGKYQLGSIPVSIIPTLSWRQHDDDFILDRYQPDWYRNRHETEQVNGNLTAQVAWSGLELLAGLEWQHDQLDSSNLGNRHRWRMGGYIDGQKMFDDHLTIHGSLGVYRIADSQFEWSPSINLGGHFSDVASWFLAAGRSYRLPTFTELYYSSPANMGNPDLTPESTISLESGLRWHHPGVRIEVAGFYRQGTDQIDWVRNTAEDPWQVKNVSTIQTTGAECSIVIAPDQFFTNLPLERIQFDYTWLNSDYDLKSGESKYMASHLEHQAVFLASHRVWAGVSCHWSIRYEDRVNTDNLILSDLRIVWKSDGLDVWFNLNNLGNKAWNSVTGVPMSGQTISVGTSISI